MKDVRIWFTKDNECRYISHLDLNRCMLRALHKSRIPIWHTEGFNVHPYATFPLPLSLGFRGEWECMDVRLVEEFDFSDLISSMNACLPLGIRLFDVTEPLMKAKEITFADFKIRVTAEGVSPDELYRNMKEVFELSEITVEKKTKKKGIKEIDIKPYINRINVERNIGGAIINITLPAGSTTNINPLLFQKAVEKYYGLEVYFDVTKQEMYNADMKPFR
jgi:radical SAM-linked protein